MSEKKPCPFDEAGTCRHAFGRGRPCVLLDERATGCGWHASLDGVSHRKYRDLQRETRPEAPEAAPT